MSKKIAIYGNGGISAALMRRISQKWQESFDITCRYMLDEKIQMPEIVGYRELKRKIAEGQIHALLLPPLGKEIAGIVKKHKEFSNIPILYAKPAIWRDKGEIAPIRQVHYKKPWLSVFEYHVNDHCNMNCKGCGHCSNLYDEPSFTSMEIYERDIRRIRELYDGVGLIRLLGGEPLLNPELYRFLKLTREIFSEADLRIVTNGILLTDMPEILLECIRNTGTVVDISVYPPMEPKVPQMKSFLDDNGIDYHIISADTFYRKFLPEGKGSIEEAFAGCFSAENHLLSDGKLACCAMPFAIRKLNESYGLDIEEDGWIQIHDNSLDGFELNRLLESPIGLCCYCSPELERYHWEQSKKEGRSLDDWMYHAKEAL